MKKTYTLTLLFLFLAFSFAAFLSSSTSDHSSPSNAKTSIEKSKICLTMIVKNEEKIIERCLNSVKDLIDYVSICDTGSTDRTVAIIEKFLQENKIPGKVHHHSWKNFGHNRTLSVAASKEMLLDSGVPLENTYLLLLDADMILEISPEFNKDSLTKHSYLIIQKNPAISYYNTRLVRASLPWDCVGVTHEYWSCTLPIQHEQLTTLSIDDQNDGGSKSDKFERDIKLLTQGLKDEPDNDRYMFYLAESYKNLGQHDEAINWFNRRIEKGGWYEEVWYSMFMLGECYQAMNDWEKALKWYLKAYEYNSERSETLEKITGYYRSKGEHHLAYLFAKLGSKIPFPKNQILFIGYPAYDYLFDEHLSIAAYYTPFKEEGYAATNRLMLKRDIPSGIRDQAYKNILFYIEKLNDAQYQHIDVELPLVREGLTSKYNPLNPSIQKTADGYNVICRAVNYIQIEAKHFKSLDILEPNIKTRNFLIKYDRDLKKMSQKEIIENLPRKKYVTRPVEGLEDCRLVTIGEELWVSCTTLDTNPFGQPQVSLCKLSENESDTSVTVERLVTLTGPDPQRCEKNWLPFMKDHKLHMIYSYDPLTIYGPTLHTDLCPINRNLLIKSTPQAYNFSRFSGSAAPIEFDEGYLILVHETLFDNQRYYTHRFVYMDHDLSIKKVSKPFVFLHKGIEYCCGITLDHSEKNLIMGIGVEDREAYLCTVPVETVRKLLVALENL